MSAKLNRHRTDPRLHGCGELLFVPVAFPFARRGRIGVSVGAEQIDEVGPDPAVKHIARGQGLNPGYAAERHESAEPGEGDGGSSNPFMSVSTN